MSGFLQERPVLRTIDMNPAKINLGALDVLFKAQPKRTVKGEHARDGAVPSSSMISKLRRMLNRRGTELFGIDFSKLDVEVEDVSDSIEEDEDDVSDESTTMSNFWRFEDMTRFVSVVLETFGVDEKEWGARPLKIKISI